MAGPPCAGKSTYVRERAAPGALVLDQDVIGRKAMLLGLAQIHRVTGEVWVIRCVPGQDERARFARSIGADDVVLLCPAIEELHARADARPNPKATRLAIRKWFLKEHGLSVPKSVHRTGGRARAVRAATFAEKGTTCVICGHEGATESGHVVSLADDPGQALSSAGREPVHGTSARCPTCGRACNQEQGRRHASEMFRPTLSW